MPIEKQLTSLELSKRLKELGVKQESIVYWKIDSGKLHCTCSPTLHAEENNTACAYTVAELGELLKGTGHDLPWWFYGRAYPNGAWHWSIMQEDDSEPTEADARASMLIALLENALITL